MKHLIPYLPYGYKTPRGSSLLLKGITKYTCKGKDVTRISSQAGTLPFICDE
jgi:hypothetical protein